MASNSPSLAPPRKAAHSSAVNLRTGPCSRLLRTPMQPSGRLATSTQLPLAKDKELLTQVVPVSVATLVPPWCARSGDRPHARRRVPAWAEVVAGFVAGEAQPGGAVTDRRRDGVQLRCGLWLPAPHLGGAAPQPPRPQRGERGGDERRGDDAASDRPVRPCRGGVMGWGLRRHSC